MSLLVLTSLDGHESKKKTILSNFTEDEDISSLNPNLLLYKSAGVHNLPVMCQAFALGANKSWTNANDLNRTALHQAILSVSIH